MCCAISCACVLNKRSSARVKPYSGSSLMTSKSLEPSASYRYLDGSSFWLSFWRPAQTSAAAVLAEKPDGVFLSNGPGDPEPCDYAIAAIREFLAVKIPIFGICLGHQLLGLASGAKTLKMKFGHHGANHPVIDLDSKRVMITSQNHGFAVDESTLPNNVRVTHRSLFDGSNQGIELTDAPAFSFQGHPEASPGPHDVSGLFDRFITMMEAR